MRNYKKWKMKNYVYWDANLFLVLSTNNVESYANYMTIYDYYYDDDYIYYIWMFHCLKCNCLNMSLVVKGNKNKKDKNKEQQQQGNFIQHWNRMRFLCFYRYFIYFLQRLYKKKPQMKNVFIIIIITLYIYDYDYDYKWTKWRK